MTSIIELRAGTTSCGIAPDIGCAVTHFRTGAEGAKLDWLRPYDATRSASVPSAEAGCFPLVPYSGRIANGVLSWRGRRYSLPTGLLGDPHALHGTGWVSAWRVRSVGVDSAEFVHAYSGADWPFPFEATLNFSLVEGALGVSIAVTNTGTAEMPAGLGLHPIFAGRDISLRAAAATVWNIDDNKLFAGKSPAAPPWDFLVGAPLRGTQLEHGFSGWDGAFEITWPNRRSALVVTASEHLRHLVIYSRAYDDTNEDFVCVEPVSHSVDGFNLSESGIEDTGTLALSPGETCSAGVEFTITG